MNFGVSDNSNVDQFMQFVEKLSHPLEEIRCRTLANIHSKLDRGLLPSDRECLSKLVKSLLLSLQKDPSFETNRIFIVLKSLLANSEVKSFVVLAGGLSLLTKMRNSPINDELKKHIDDICAMITENPSINEAHDVSLSNAHKGVDASSYFNCCGSASVTLTSSYSSQTRKVSFNLSATRGNSSTSDGSRFSSCYSSDFFHQNYFLYFPTITLTKADVGVLRTTLKSVCSKECSVCLSGIHFLRDVVLKDFPAELFLQRTEFITNLFRILNGNNLELIYATTSFLIKFCHALIERVYYHLDPNNYKFSTTHSGDPLTPRGPSETLSLSETDQTGFTFCDSMQQNGSVSATIKTNVLNSDEDVRRQSYSLVEFCFQLFSTITSSLLTVFEYHNQDTEQERSYLSKSNISHNCDWKYKMESEILLLLDVGISLLLTSLSPHRRTHPILEVSQNNQISDLTSFTNFVFLVSPPTTDLIKSSDLPSDFYACMQQFGSVLSLYSTSHRHYSTKLSESHLSWNTSEMVDYIAKAQLPCECQRQTYIGLITETFRLISSLFTPETALAVLPVEVKTQLSISLLDVSVLIESEVKNDSRKYGLPAYIAMFNSTIYSSWLLFHQLRLSMFSLIDFLDNSENFLLSNTTNEQINETNLNLAMNAVNSLDITGSTRFASNYVQFLSRFYVTHQNISATVLWHGQLVLLQMLSHEMVAVRKATYSELLKLLKIAVNPNFAADPSSSLETVNFLIEEEILCEWINFGLKDENSEVSSLACEGLSLLLNSYEYISDSGWKKLRRLLIEPTSPSPSIKVSRPLTISLGPFAFKNPQTSSSDTNTLGSIILDWCLGRMSSVGKQNLEEQNLDKHSLMHILTSSCRLLLHPIDAVRFEAASTINWCLLFRWKNLLPCRPNSTTLTEHQIDEMSSNSSNCRIVTGISDQIDVSESDRKNICKTSTPLLCCNSTSCAERLQNQLVSQFNNKPPSLILNREQVTSMNFANDSLEPIEYLIQMMKILTDDQGSVNARKAAAEQVIIFIRRPALLSAWRIQHGPEFIVNWITNTVNDMVLSMKSTQSQDLFNPLINPNSPVAVLTPLVVQIACLAAIWDTSTRIIFSWEPDFLSNIIYLLIVFPGPKNFQRDLIDLITLIAFTAVIQVSNESPVCLPQEVVAGYLLPFTCPTYSFNSQWRGSNSEELVSPFRSLSKLANCTNEDENTQILRCLVKRNFRYLWAFACHKGVSNLISHTLSMIGAIPDPNLVNPSNLDICLKRAREYSPLLNQFSLSCLDITLLLVSHPTSSFLLSLACIRQATNHSYLLKSLGLLYRSLSAHKIQYYHYPICNSMLYANDTQMDTCKVSWWIYAKLNRFMTTLPSCSADYNLLASVLCTIHEVGFHLMPSSLNYFSHSSKEYLCNWIMSLIGDTQGPLSYCLLQPKAGIGETDSSRLISAKKYLTYHCLPYLLNDLFDSFDKLHNMTENSSTDVFTKYVESNMADLKVYEVCFQWACNTLEEFVSSPFSDLVRLNRLVGILARLTSIKFTEIVRVLYDDGLMERILNPVSKILTTFIQRRNHLANNSFMGSSTIVLLLMTMNNLIHNLSAQSFLRQLDLNDVLSNNMEYFHKYIAWIDEEWLLQSLTYRHTEIRALALSILSRVCLVPVWLHRLLTRSVSTETRTRLFSHSLMWSSPGSIWELGFHFLMDPNETCWVRAMASHLLINLTLLPMNPKDSVLCFPPSINELTSNNSEETRQINSIDASELLPVTTAATTVRRLTAPNNILHSDVVTMNLQEILNSNQFSQQLKDNITHLIDVLKPWTDELFTEENVIIGIDQQLQSIPVLRSEPPKNITMPVYVDSDTNLYLIGLPALYQLLVSKAFFKYLYRLIISHMPQTMFTLSQWHRIAFQSYNKTEQTVTATSLTDTQSFPKITTPHTTPREVSTTTTTSTNTNHFTDSTLSGTNNTTSSECYSSHICTPLLLSSVIHLLVNLMHHLPKFILSELKLQRISSLLMNIIDPNLLEAIIQQTHALTGVETNHIYTKRSVDCNAKTMLNSKNSYKELIQCYTNCIHVLRCQTAMNEETRMNLMSDALFLTRIIKILTIPISYIDVMASLWQEIFLLLTCLLIHSNDDNSKSLNLRLILKPLANVLPQFLDIILAFIDKAELEVSRECKDRQSTKFCVHARIGLQLLTVIMSNQRPVSLNPVVNCLESETLNNSKYSSADKSIPGIVYLTRRLVKLSNSYQCLPSLFSSLDGVSPRMPNHSSMTVIINYRKAIDNALRTLIGICHAFKITVVEDGFIEESIAKLQLLCAKMELCCSNVSILPESEKLSSCDSRRSLSSRGSLSIDQKCERRQQTLSTWLKLSDEMIANIEILHNLVYMCPEARMRAIESGIIQLIICIWSLALQDTRILHALLGLLTNLTADCPQASSILVNPPNSMKIIPNILPLSSENSSSRSNIQTNRSKSDAPILIFNSSNSVMTNNSFIQSLCNLIPMYSNLILTESNNAWNANTMGTNVCGKPVGSTQQEITWKLVFHLLANMVWAAETRSSLLKSKLLNQISGFSPRVMVKTRRDHFMLTLWLEFLVNLSFSRDGQQMLLCQSNLPSILVSCVTHCKPGNRDMALIILRNLCTNNTLKSRLLTGNLDVLGCFRDILLDANLDSNALHSITVVVSAIEASICGNKKICVFMKSNSFLRYLTHFWELYQTRSEFLPIFPRIRSLIMKLQE
ncbi:unnamed protein product [Trichobilharzia szidati]|nr:unnamed protein product [Trichobilharzia szidati]